MAKTELYKIIASGDFWTLPEDQLLTIVQDTFPDELNRLKKAYALALNPNFGQQSRTPSISGRLYAEKFDEVDRTFVGVLAFRWIWNGDYNTFVGESLNLLRLKPRSFRRLQHMFKTNLTTPEDIFALVVSMITNDFGKDHHMAEDYAKLKGIDISKVNHDMILHHAVEANMVPALRLLEPEYLAYVKFGIKLSSKFNFGQLAQCENAPASLNSLQKMEGQSKALQMRFLEQILDVSGAAGHEDWTCARTMTEDVFQSYQNVYDVATGIISRTFNSRYGYDILLVRKQAQLKQLGFSKEFNIDALDGRATLRLFCLGRVSNEKLATVYDAAFNNFLPHDGRKKLIYALNVGGSVEEPAVQPTYAPVMLTKALNNTHPGTTSPAIRVAAVLEYLAKVMTLTVEDRANFPQGVTVVERDIRCIKEIVEGQNFMDMPSASLKEAGVPEGHVANMV